MQPRTRQRQPLESSAWPFRCLANGDPGYPQSLRDIFDPPIVLFALGRVDLLQSLALAVVVTRRPTAYGITVAERLSADLAHADFTIVSGIARGIDSSAHKGCLAAGGDTLAVLGCGVDVVYPSENRKLYSGISAKGSWFRNSP